MKKLLLSLVTLLAAISFTQVSYANISATTPYHSQAETIENALHTSKMAKGMGPATNIVVINYTDNSFITVLYPIMYPNQPILSPKTATRITNETWTGYTEIHLSDGRQVFYVNPYLTPQSIVSVYVSAGQYVVNVTNG